MAGFRSCCKSHALAPPPLTRVVSRSMRMTPAFRPTPIPWSQFPAECLWYLIPMSALHLTPARPAPIIQHRASNIHYPPSINPPVLRSAPDEGGLIHSSTNPPPHAALAGPTPPHPRP